MPGATAPPHELASAPARNRRSPHAGASIASMSDSMTDRRSASPATTATRSRPTSPGRRRHRPARRRGGHPPPARLRPRAPRRSSGASPNSATTRSAPTCTGARRPDAAPDDAAAAARANGGVPDERLVGDVAGAAAVPARAGDLQRQGRRDRLLLRRPAVACSPPATSTSTRRSTATARSSTGTPPAGFPLKVTNLVDQLPEPAAARCWACSATRTSTRRPEHVDELDAAPDRATARRYEFHRYDGAGHAFFAVDRPSYRRRGGQRRLGADRRFFAPHLG